MNEYTIPIMEETDEVCLNARMKTNKNRFIKKLRKCIAYDIKAGKMGTYWKEE